MTEKPKLVLLKFLQQYYDAERLYGQSFYALNSKSVIYFRYSKRLRDSYFFGVETDDLGRYESRNTFILFICGDERRVIVLPVQDFLSIVEGVQPVSNQWKVNIADKEGRWLLRVSGKGRFDVTGFLNFFDFMQKDLRCLKWPELGELIPVRERPEKEQAVEALEEADLGQELVASGRDPKHYSVFEVNVTRALVELGLHAERLGGPGSTDVLVKEPFRAVIDCKSTSSGSLSQINFTRIKRHQQENQAEFCAVISENFDPAVSKDAEIEGMALIRTETLAELLHLNLQFPIGPGKIRALFLTKGLANEGVLENIRLYVSEMKAKVQQVALILEVLDFVRRPLHEVRGRLSGRGSGEFTTEQLSEALDFLCHPILDVVDKSEGGFSLKMPPLLAERRVKAVLSGLSQGLSKL